MRKAVLLTLALAATLASLSTLAPPAESQIVLSGECDSIRRQLAVNYDVTGGTLTGPVNINLQVYSNGEVKYSRSSGFSPGATAGGSLLPVPSTSVQHVSVGPNEVKRLLKALELAGAFSLCDQNIAVADVPLSSLTVLKGRDFGKYHGFSWYLGFGGGYSDVSRILSQFISANIPNA